jgi:hypothetical protein
MKLTSLALAGLNALSQFAVGAPSPADTPHVAPAANDATAARVNLASRVAVEQTWLRVPQRCKDRSFAFDPVVVGEEAAPAGLQALHAQLDGAVA